MRFKIPFKIPEDSALYLMMAFPLILAIVLVTFFNEDENNGVKQQSESEICFVDDDKLRADLRDFLQRDIAGGGGIEPSATGHGRASSPKDEGKQKEMERSFLQAARQLAAEQKCLVVNKDSRIVAMPPTARERDFTAWFGQALNLRGGEENGQ